MCLPLPLKYCPMCMILISRIFFSEACVSYITVICNDQLLSHIYQQHQHWWETFALLTLVPASICLVPYYNSHDPPAFLQLLGVTKHECVTARPCLFLGWLSPASALLMQLGHGEMEKLNLWSWIAVNRQILLSPYLQIFCTGRCLWSSDHKSCRWLSCSNGERLLRIRLFCTGRIHQNTLLFRTADSLETSVLAEMQFYLKKKRQKNTTYNQNIVYKRVTYST